ncbi:hypothetical protein DRW48_09370 [Paracoccus suum]|uniref:Uncharacterized protein n=1 Tax=Paracoccus suum TaxID=2259340 RepID=A0A344PKG5_9RHOB|nr:hypothetical protein [Paracoccus suum]AXC49870.1 hypothetical protein DRW48_09370 [Paracoccus suum]
MISGPIRPASPAPGLPATATPGIGREALAGPAAMPPVQPVAAFTAASAAREERLAEATPEPPQRAAAGAPDDRALVLALMSEAESMCRIANARSVPEGHLPALRLGWGFGREHGALEVRGELVLLGEGGYQIGAGQIYRAGQLVAAFSGQNLAFLDGGKTDRLL